MVYLLYCSFCEHCFSFKKHVVHLVTNQIEGKMTLSNNMFMLCALLYTLEKHIKYQVFSNINTIFDH